MTETQMRTADLASLSAARTGPLSVLSGAVDALLRLVIGLAILGELGAIFLNVVSRYLFATSFLWVDDVAKLALSTITFIGGAYAYRQNEHVFIRAVVERLPRRVERCCYAIAEYIVLGGIVVVGVASKSLLVTRWRELMPVLQVPAGWVVVPLAAATVVLALSAIERLARQHWPTVAGVGLCLLATGALVEGTHLMWSAWISTDLSVELELLSFFLCIVIGVPVAFALLVGALLFLYTSSSIPMVALPQNMVDGITNFVLLAIPFFIFAGIIMEQGGLSRRFVRLVQAIVGHVRGGLLQVMVVSMYVVSGMSGSKVADVAAVGSVLRSMLREQDYDMEEGTAVLAASAAMGETIPPSIAMLVLGSITTLSMASLFAAGLVPAAVLALCLMLVVYIRARRSDRRPSARARASDVLKAGIGAVLPLLMPVIIVAGILCGIATPTEVSSFAVIYGILLAALLYREMNIRSLINASIGAATTAGMILFILAAATAFSWTLTVGYLPQRLVGALTAIHAGVPLFLIGSMVLLIILGSILEGLPALLIMVPLLFPIAVQMGVNELHFGIVLLIAMAVGAFTPPVGAGFYVTCAVLGTSVEKSTRAMLPYFAVLCAGLILVGLVPWLTLIVPAALGLGVQ